MSFLRWVMRAINVLSVVVLLVIAIAFGIFYVSDHSLELIHNEKPAETVSIAPADTGNKLAGS